MSEVEKKTFWKIKDCEELLKNRPNFEYIESLMKGMDDKMNKFVLFLKKDRSKLLI